jgi:hypothetical protein
MIKTNLILCLLCLAAASPVMAEEPAAQSAPATEVVVDKEAGVIRFVVDGKTIATIDKDGLAVEGDVRYTGAMHDIGKADQNPSEQE